MTDLRALDALSDEELEAAYEPPRLPWLRLNFVQTADGSATGADGLSSSINDAADVRVFAMLRRRCDAIMVGAGTIRDEGYRPNPKPLVVVTRSGAVPPTLREGDLSQVYVATGSDAAHLAEARDLLGERVLVLGDAGPDLARVPGTLAGLGFREVLCEGGPALAGDLLARGLVDELCSTTVPRLVAGAGPRIVSGAGVDVPLRLGGLLESGGTLLARWLISRERPAGPC